MPRPRKKQDGKITAVYLERWALEKVIGISRETGIRRPHRNLANKGRETCAYGCIVRRFEKACSRA